MAIAEKGNNRIGDLHNANDKVTQADLTGERKSDEHNVRLKNTRGMDIMSNPKLNRHTERTETEFPATTQTERHNVTGNTNPIKLAKCIVALEEIEGIKNGNNQHTRDEHNVQAKTQADLANELKMSQQQLGRYKRLLDLVPELQSAVESGQISATNAGNMRFFYSYVTKIYFPNLTN